jgi:uncharacterized membrane protein YgdD (TMEM256/DUF423 family)
MEEVEMGKLFIFLGSINAFLAVAAGAFGAHALKSKLSKEMLAIFETGVNYHFLHALGLVLIGIIALKINDSNLVNWSGILFLVGIIIFSGSLYILSLTGIRALGAITPIGGVAFLAGWILLAIAAIKHF